MTEKRKEFEQLLEAQLTEWGAQINGLKEKVKQTQSEVREEYQKTLDALQVRHDEARVKLHELKTAGDEAWEGIKVSAEHIWDKAKTGFHEAASRFK